MKEIKKMKEKSVITRVIFALLASVLFAACNPPIEEGVIKPYTCVVVNQGNFTESNGSISLYNRNTGEVQQEVYNLANGRNFAAMIESVLLHNDLLIVMCNSEDKIVFVNAITMQEVCAPITNIGTPRYGVVKGSKLYVSCWSPTFMPGGGEEIAVIDLSTKTKVASIPSNYYMPEGVQIVGENLYVAVEGGVDVYNTATNSYVTTLTSSQSPRAIAQNMVSDKNGKLWVSMGGFYNDFWEIDNSQNGFMCIDPSTNDIISQVLVPIMASDAEIAISPQKDKIYFISGDIFSDGHTPIYVFDVDSKTASGSPIITGEGFYGIGVEPYSGDIYTANIQNYISNSNMYVYNAQGVLQNTKLTGIATCRFVFQ